MLTLCWRQTTGALGNIGVIVGCLLRLGARLEVGRSGWLGEGIEAGSIRGLGRRRRKVTSTELRRRPIAIPSERASRTRRRVGGRAGAARAWLACGGPLRRSLFRRRSVSVVEDGMVSWTGDQPICPSTKLRRNRNYTLLNRPLAYCSDDPSSEGPFIKFILLQVN